jgi:hypothetical protein
MSRTLLPVIFRSCKNAFSINQLALTTVYRSLGVSVGIGIGLGIGLGEERWKKKRTQRYTVARFR